MNFFKALFILVVICASFYFFSDNKVDPDLWGHLKFGEDIYEELKVPLYDTYSYSSYGARWINHEWLSELAFYTVFRFTAGAGLLALKFLAGLAMAFLIYFSVCRDTESLLLKMMFIILPLSVIGYGFATRPQIFTYLFFAVTVFLIDRFERTGRPRWLYLLPLVFLLWCNLHGGFVAGVGVLFIYCLFKAFKKKAGKSLIFVTFFSLSATLINPNGTALWVFLSRTLSAPRPYLEEWGRVAFSSNFTDYFAVLILAGIGLIFSRRKRNPYEITILFMAFLVSFFHNRHIVLFAILFAFLMPKYLDSFARDTLIGMERKFPASVFAVVLLCFSLIFLHGGLFVRKTDPLKIEVPEGKYPVNAVKFMKDNRIGGNIFCFFDWAEMCIRELSPRSKVFFDGRYRTVYSEELIEGYFGVLYGERDYKDYLDKFPETDIMLLHPFGMLTAKVSEDKGWIKVYDSDTAVLLLRHNENNKDAIKRYMKNELVYKPKKEPFYLE
ncbi:MAG: hypothetical protein WBB86_01840 [Candidatus Omnitrophota bacterium]